MLSLRKLTAFGAAIAGILLAPAIANAQQTTAFTTSDLNLRQGPGTQYQIILAMPQGSQVTVNHCANNSSWCHLTFGQYAGWASSRYLTTTPPRYVAGPAPQPQYPQQPHYPQQPQVHAPVVQPSPPPPPHVVQPHPQPPPYYHYYGWRYPWLNFRFNFWFH